MSVTQHVYFASVCTYAYEAMRDACADARAPCHADAAAVILRMARHLFSDARAARRGKRRATRARLRCDAV